MNLSTRDRRAMTIGGVGLGAVVRRIDQKRWRCHRRTRHHVRMMRTRQPRECPKTPPTRRVRWSTTNRNTLANLRPVLSPRAPRPLRPARYRTESPRPRRFAARDAEQNIDIGRSVHRHLRSLLTRTASIVALCYLHPD